MSEQDKSKTADEAPKDEQNQKQDPPADETLADEGVDKDKPDEGADNGDEGGAGEEEELDLERAKAKIAKANDEARSLRQRLRDAEDKLKDAKTPEEVEEIRASMSKDRVDSERSLLIENVALKHKLPEELAEVLKGDTREELEAHAKKLQKFAQVDEDDEVVLQGGLTPNSGGDTDEDPRSLAARYGPRGKRR